MLRVLVVEDSSTARRLLVAVLGADPAIEVVGEACDGVEGVSLCKKLRPDLVTMDIQMPNMDGVEATRQIMIQSATPIVMVSSLDPSDVRRSMHALNAGALAVLAKPAGPGSPRFERDTKELLSTVKAMAQVKLVRRWPTSPSPSVVSAPTAASPGHRIVVVGIVASTGGPNALRSVLAGLPADFEPPILIVQHIAAGFAQGFAEWLASATGRRVELASDGTRLTPNVTYVAPDDRHLELVNDRIVVSSTAPVDGFRPSGTSLFRSLAALGNRAIGVILTGMGQDGVAGLREMRDAGAAVFAQDEATSDIFGMPGAALKAGLVTAGTPLPEIPLQVTAMVRRESSGG
ncbi:MAG: chemotaxis-specific protein-glutamate methyltransferase CheB [Kofleriaceae bacterium]